MTGSNRAIFRKRDVLAERARILQATRSFFIARGYLEIETPHRLPANAPEPHIDPVPSGRWALHTSPELAMKRLLAAGYEKIFQLCRVWRDQERGQYHLPEFTLLEWYRAGVDYTALMTECTELLQALVPEGCLVRQERRIDLSSPWEELTVTEAFARHASMGVTQALQDDCFEEILTSEVEPSLGRVKPTFLTEYPSALAALARLKPGDPAVSERFELYIDGMEIANAFSELTDPVEQRHRFESDEGCRRAAGKPPYPLPEPFLRELATLPESAGIALGFDRLVMLLCDVQTIDDVVAFTPEDL